MDNLSIKQRFVLLIGIIIAIGLLTIFQAWRTMQPLVDDFNTYLEEVSERRHLLEQMDLALGYGGAIHQFKNYVLRGTDKYYDRYIQKYEWFQDILGKYRSLPNLSNVESQALTDIADTIALYRKNLDLARDLIQQGKTTKEIDGIIKISDKPALDALNTLGDEMQTLTTNSHATLELHLEEGMAGMIGSVALSLALVIIGCLWIYASIAVPLNRAVSAMEDIAQGNGDLTQRLEAKGRNELAMLAGSFNTFIGKIQDLVGRTHSTSQQLAAAAEETSIISGETSQGIQKQHQETDRVVSAMSEIANASDDVGQHADQAEEAAERAMKEAEKGRTVVDQAVQSINGLAAEVQRASEVIHRLEQDTNTIGAVLDVIGGIAEQTNLLALNAAIEAARAGEQGRGFAVVADEVRSLASRTQEATAEIQSMIERLQNGANDAVTVMNEGRERANTSVEQAGQAGSSLAEITTAVSGITALNRNIVNALEGQNQMTQGVNGGLHNISQVAESTAQGAAQTAQASQDLARLASELQTTVQQFRV